MLKPAVERSFLEDLKKVRDGLACSWNNILERFQILYFDKKSRKLRVVMTIENEDETYRAPDRRTILYLSQFVAWGLMDQFPDSKDMYNHFVSSWAKQKQHKKNMRQDYRKWWNKERKNQWRQAIELAKKGIWALPDNPERKIITYGEKPVTEKKIILTS